MTDKPIPAEDEPGPGGARQEPQASRAGRPPPRAPAAKSAAAKREDLVDDAGMGSFPASDPPGWWSGR